eukprot:scaffold230132_cov17-Tisochrysis_lutea.AAC.1
MGLDLESEELAAWLTARGAARLPSLLIRQGLKQSRNVVGQAPNCKEHNEPAVIRQVKKKGPTQ